MTVDAQAVAVCFGLEVRGPSDLEIRAPEPLELADSGSLTWVKSFNEANRAALDRLAGAVVVAPIPVTPQEEEGLRRWSDRNAIILTDNPRLTFARLLARFFSHLEAHVPSGADPTARVDETARIGQEVTIGAFCFIGAEAVVGDGTVLHPGAVVHSRTVIGRNCIIGSHAVIGNRGFGFVRDETGALVHFPQVGAVVLEDDVEIKACTVIDRPGLGATRIKRGTKIDNLCHVGHGAQIGPHAVVVACAEIGAGVVIEEGAWIGPNSCSLERVSFGRQSTAGIGAVVLRDVPPGSVVAATPARRLP